MAEQRSQDWSGIEILSPEECLERLRSSAIGRVAFLEAGSPSVLPVNYALDGRRIVFRTAPGSKLAAAMMRNSVAFEVDTWDDQARSGWSVLAKGTADHVLEDDELERLEQLGLEPWTGPELRDQWVRILIDELTGRAVPGDGDA